MILEKKTFLDEQPETYNSRKITKQRLHQPKHDVPLLVNSGKHILRCLAQYMRFSPHLISAMQDAAVLTRLGFLPLGQKLIRISLAFALHSLDELGSVNSPKYGNEMGGFALESHSLDKLRPLGSP